jgi:hypothetical protein
VPWLKIDPFFGGDVSFRPALLKILEIGSTEKSYKNTE